MDAVIVREGKNLKGRTLGAVLGTVGKGVLAKAFAHSIKAIEARNTGARSTGATSPSDEDATQQVELSRLTAPILTTVEWGSRTPLE